MNPSAQRSTRPRLHAQRAPRARGFTLVEILVTLAISVFLLGGLFTLVQNTLRVSGQQTALAALQDQQRLALTMIADVVQQAGYFPDPTTHIVTTDLPSVTLTAPNWTAGQPLVGAYTAAVPHDTLTVRYYTMPNDGVINCTGGSNGTGGGVRYYNTFSIDPSSNLICRVGTTATGGTSSILVAGVTDMQIWYGVNTSGTSNGSVDTYFRADQMTAANWSNVLTVKVRLLFNNPMYDPNKDTRQTLSVTRVVCIMNRCGVNS